MSRALRQPDLCALLLIAAFAACTSSPGMRDHVPAMPAAEWERLAAAEDARAASAEDLAVLRTALASGNAAVRAMAVRALGRTERSELAVDIAPFLSDASDSVRVAAARALANVSRDTVSAGAARPLLLDALVAPGTTGPVAGAILESIGRLPTDAVTAPAVVSTFVPFLANDDAARTGAVRGLYFMALRPALRPSVATAADPLRSVSRNAGTAFERGLALITLGFAQAADESTLMAALDDADDQVRRAAAWAGGQHGDATQVRRVLDRALSDASPAVRYDALAGYGRRLSGTHGCAPVTAAVHDAANHVSLLALDLLRTACVSQANVPLLDSIAAAIEPGLHGWHHAARAVGALAATDRVAARSPMRVLAQHPVEFARAHAARAAHTAADTALLYELARDPSPNVRTAAVAGLAAIVGRNADSVYIAQLTTDESELLMAAAAALEGSRAPGIATRMLDALDRVSALQRETSRDGRVALLTRVREVGSAADAERVRTYLHDFDPRVAALAASVLEDWTGTRPAPEPRPLPALPLPSHADAVRLTRSAFILVMDDGSEIEIRLLPFAAPTNAARFARLAREGYYDGLTLHRIAPNFVVQGGSPGANEYNGDGPFTRDEVGVSHRRGTVGLSTRGRDTGDAQIFINLVDNVRLDYDYTVFGVVTRGMSAVDTLREGVVIRQIREELR